MKKITLLNVSKTVTGPVAELEKDLLKRFKLFELELISVSPCDDDVLREEKLLLQKISSLRPHGPLHLITLEERGKLMKTEEFSEFLHQNLALSRPIFIFGGASGHGPQILEKSQFRLSLSPMTFPHQWARAILIEQIYRAQCLHSGHPYHK